MTHEELLRANEHQEDMKYTDSLEASLAKLGMEKAHLLNVLKLVYSEMEYSKEVQSPYFEAVYKAIKLYE